MLGDNVIKLLNSLKGIKSCRKKIEDSIFEVENLQERFAQIERERDEYRLKMQLSSKLLTYSMDDLLDFINTEEQKRYVQLGKGLEYFFNKMRSEDRNGGIGNRKADGIMIYYESIDGESPCCIDWDLENVTDWGTLDELKWAYEAQIQEKKVRVENES